MTHPCTILAALLLCCGVLCHTSARAEEPAWEPAATIEGVPYQRVEELRSFYKLTPTQPSAKGATAMSLGSMRLELGPGKREMRLGGLQQELFHPLQHDASGQLLISRKDWTSRIDPILRPTYIDGREVVRRVVIDPGHGGHDPGVTAGSMREADFTLQVAQRLRDELEKQGCRVILTRTADYSVSDQQRVDIANAEGASLFVSLHVNTGRSDLRGVRVYTVAPPAPGASPLPTHARSGSHAALAYALQSALVYTAGAADAGCHSAHYTLLSSVTAPAAWVELGYATHEAEGPALASPAYRDTLAQALAQGILTYIKVANPATSIPIQAAPPKPAPAPKKAAPAPAPKKATPAPTSTAKKTPVKRSTPRRRRR